MRVLFSAQVGAGHWRPLAPLARALALAGHEVAFATTPIGCGDIAPHGFRTFPVGTDEWLRKVTSPGGIEGREAEGARRAEPAGAASVWADVFVPNAARCLPDLLAVALEWRPDLIVREETEFAGAIVAEWCGVPHATVQVSAWRGGAFDGLIAAPLARLRASVGLPPAPDLAWLHRYLTLFPCPPRLCDPAIPLPPSARFIQPANFDRDHRAGAEVPPWVPALPARPTVYATLGTAYARVPGVFDAILAALRDEPTNVIATVNHDQDPAAFGPQPPHIHLARYIPQGLLLPRCDLVITHGGSGTVRAALDHGLPLVIIPLAADQPANARRCAALGVARVVPPEARTPAAIRAAVRDVLADPRYRRNAAALRDEGRALPGPGEVVALLERLAAERRPLPAG